MDKKVITAMVGAVSFILGGAVGYFVSKKGFSKELADLKDENCRKLGSEIDKLKSKFDEEIETAKNQYDVLIEEEKIKTAEETKNDILEKITNTYQPKEEKEEEKVFPHTKPKRDFINYAKAKYGSKKHLMDQYEEESEDENDEDDEYPISPSEGLREEPYLISESDFMQRNEFDKVCFIYFEGDDVLSTEDGENVNEEIKYTVGENFRALIRDNNGMDPTYIRNEKMSTDYEIYVEDGDNTSFYDTFIKEK